MQAACSNTWIVSASKRSWSRSLMARRLTPELVFRASTWRRQEQRRRGSPSNAWDVAPRLFSGSGSPDGAVADRLQDLTDALSCLLRPDDLCLTPWRLDGHADHEATGTATIATARTTCTSVLEYLVWTWHWTTPGSGVIPWSQCRRLDLGRRQSARKRWATCAYASQIRPFGDSAGPILADSVLRRFWRRFEVFIEAGS